MFSARARKGQALFSCFFVFLLKSTCLYAALPKATPSDLMRAVQMIHNTTVSGRLFLPEPKLTITKSVWQNYGSISGQIFGLDSSAIGSAYVTAWSVDSVTTINDMGLALVDTNFHYCIDSLAAGRYFVMAWADGYYSQYYDRTDDPALAIAVDVTADQVTDGINFYLEKITPGTGSIAGNVLSAADEQPIAEAVVYVFSADKPYYYGKAQTDTNGHYLISELKTGQYIAEVYARGYLPELYDNAHSYENASKIPVQEPYPTDGIDFKLDKCGSISGRVTDRNGQPLAAVVLTTEPVEKDTINDWQAPFICVAYSEEDGHYLIDGLAQGSYYVRADYYDPAKQICLWFPDVTNLETARPVAVQAGLETAHIDFHFDIKQPIGAISGRITNLSGKPVANASIHLQYANWEQSNNWFGFYASSDSNGFFTIEQIPSGHYIVSCWAQSGWQTCFRYWPDSETIEGAKRIIIDDDNPSARIDFVLPLTSGTAKISGTVRSDDGRPLAWANIQLSGQYYATLPAKNSSPIWAYATSDSLGNYSIADLPAGEYIAYCSYWENQSFGQQWYLQADSSQFATPIFLQENEHRSDIDFSLNIRPFYGAIVGTVLDAATNQPISRAYVEIKRIWQNDTPSFRHFAWYPYYTLTDESGHYRMEWLAEGQYLVSVYTNGAFAYYPDAIVPSLATPIKVYGGLKTEANFNLKLRYEGDGSITGRVTTTAYPVTDIDTSKRSFSAMDDSPLEIAIVMAKPVYTILVWPQSELFYTAVTDKEGYYSLKGLPYGEYYVYSFAPYHMLQYYDQVLDPAEAKHILVQGLEPVKDIDFKLQPMLYRFLDTPGNKENYRNSCVFGKIVDSKNQSVADATVYLLDERGTPISYTLSDANGNYHIWGISAGKYYLQVAKVGYTTTFNGNVSTIQGANAFFISQGMLEVNIILNPQMNTVVKRHLQPNSLTLIGTYPNPFNPETTITFTTPQPMHITIRIYNLRGEEIRLLFQGTLPEGQHEQKWDGRDSSGNVMANGLYICCLETAKEIKTSKLLFLK